MATFGPPFVNTGQLADGAVTSAKIALDTIVAADVAENGIGDTEIAAHTTTKITVPTSQLSGTISTAQIADNAVTGAKIAMGSDAQGDILYYNGTDYARLGAGTSGQVLKTNGAGQNPSWTDNTPTQTITTLTAGVALVAGDAVFIEDSTTFDTSQIITDTATNNDTNQGFGRTTTTGTLGKRAAQQFTTTSAFTCDKIIAYLSKAGAPGDNVRIGIQADSSGAPSGSYLSSGTVAAADIGAASAAETFTMAAPISLSASTTYWVVAERTGSLDDTNYYRPGSGIYSGSTFYIQSSADAWAVGTDMKVWHVEIVETSIAGRAYKTSAATAGKYETFVGFSNGTYALGATASIVTAGIMTGLSGLTVGKVYYLSDTAGAIAASAGSNSRKVGVSLSTTTLLMSNII